MSQGSTPPPGDDRPDPTGNPEEGPAEGYGSPPPPPPQYGSSEPPASAAPQPEYQEYAPPPPPAAGGYGAPSPADADYGASPPVDGGYAPPPPPAYGQQGYGAAPAYAGPYEQGNAVGTLAQWPQRALGWVIDFIALAIPGWILYAIGGPKTEIVGTTVTQTAPNFVYYLGVLYFLALSIYNRWYRGGTTGYTIGRGVAGVKLVKESTGQPIGMGMAFVRDIAHIVDSIICYVGWLFPLWDTKRQTLADKIMSTVVLAQPQSKG
ncbi:MAG: RDD family protein [Lapillicoccus sp.]